MAKLPRKVVAKRAHMIWLEAGCPEGSRQAHWLQAEHEIGVVLRATQDDPFVALQMPATEPLQAGEKRGSSCAWDLCVQVKPGRNGRPLTKTLA